MEPGSQAVSGAFTEGWVRESFGRREGGIELPFANSEGRDTCVGVRVGRMGEVMLPSVGRVWTYGEVGVSTCI